MKIKYEIERKIEGDNGKKSEKETTITFDDLPDVKKKVKGVGAFLAKQAKKTAEAAGNIAAVVTYNAAALTANALDSVADTADTVVNSIDRFLDKKFEVVEEEVDEENCDDQCCGECCCGETCEDGVENDAESNFADSFCSFLDNILSAFCNDDETTDEEETTDDDETSEDEDVSDEETSSESKENPVENFAKTVMGELETVYAKLFTALKTDEAKRTEQLKEVYNYISNLDGTMKNYFNTKIKNTEETSEDEGTEENTDSDIEENPVEIFLKGVIGDVEKASCNVIAFLKADENAKADYINKLAKRFGIKIEKTEKISKEEEDAYEDEIEKVSDDSSKADEPAEEVVPEKSIEEKVADIPEGAKYSLREFLDYMNVYKCDEKVVDPVKEACIFFAAIKYPVTMYSRKAFENATTLEKITYENVVKAIKNYFPDDSEDQILDHLHDEFDEWVASTNIKKYCPNLNFRYLLMYFVSKVRGCD